METIVRLAGAGQLLLAAVSLTVPRTLGWREETAKLRPLTRHVFWTYAAYIFIAHVCFGLLSALAPRLLLDGSPLATPNFVLGGRPQAVLTGRYAAGPPPPRAEPGLR